MLPPKVMNSMMKKSKSSDITCDQVVSAAAKLRDGVDALRFGPPFLGLQSACVRMVGT